ncbi:hypothetical protein EG68_03039 [Paragonimus skrjabini miyazakii]|uniref:Uncharacterized protein n=1 Tax=Paragonimus skrjabini miyazakii TaxID=59628 RepID=A0A8S9Z7Q0_9TREM|nr:hypothetical protein EG68_03039 [Paragonimus skrjabini miyazakii]
MQIIALFIVVSTHFAVGTTTRCESMLSKASGDLLHGFYLKGCGAKQIALSYDGIKQAVSDCNACSGCPQWMRSKVESFKNEFAACPDLPTMEEIFANLECYE